MEWSKRASSEPPRASTSLSVAMKKPKPLEIKEDPALKARRQARREVGTVTPVRVLTPRNLKPPRHKKKIEEGDLD